MIEDIVLEFTDEPELVMETDRPFDLIGDTVSKETVLAGILFHMPNGVPEYGTCTYDADTSDGTAQPSDISEGKIAYSHGHEIVGTYTFAGATQATATAGQIKTGKTAWVNGTKLTGTWTPKATLTQVSNLTNLEFWIPQGQYSPNQTIQIPFNVENVYVSSMSNIPSQNVSIRYSSGQIASQFSYTGLTGSSGTNYLNIKNNGGMIVVSANSIKVVVSSVTGTFIQAWIT